MYSIIGAVTCRSSAIVPSVPPHVDEIAIEWSKWSEVILLAFHIYISVLFGRMAPAGTTFLQECYKTYLLLFYIPIWWSFLACALGVCLVISIQGKHVTGTIIIWLLMGRKELNLIWFFTSHQQSFSYAGTGIHWLNQYLARINVSCSRTTRQWGRRGSNTRLLGLESSTLPLSHCAPYISVVHHLVNVTRTTSWMNTYTKSSTRLCSFLIKEIVQNMNSVKICN